VAILGGTVLTVGGVMLWYHFIFPHLHYHPLTGAGVRFFGSFVDQYKTMPFRRLPMMEMSELEFYSWWPLRLILLVFVTNMVTATLRRIEFSFPYLGVLTVHTGIVTIALGSIYYSAHKQEGDMFLSSGPISEDGTPAPGDPETGFYDNTRTVLWLFQQGRAEANTLTGPRWDQRLLTGMPRYHEYNINALGLKSLPPIMAGSVANGQRDLSIEVPADTSPAASVDPDIRFRIVGYAPYAELVTRLLRAGDVDTGKLGSSSPEAVRTVEAYLNLPADPSDPDAADPTKPRRVWRLMPDSAARRVDLLSVEDQSLLGVEYTRGMNALRWRDLGVSLPKGTLHALVVRHPATGFESIYPVQRGSRLSIGPTGYTIEVEELAPEPPFPIVTKGFEGGRSSVAIVHVQPPATATGASTQPAYQRWIYHRYPEINQDLLDVPEGASSAESAMPRRRNADPGLEISYIDASIIQIYFDEAKVGDQTSVRALVRLPGGAATETPNVVPGGNVPITQGFSLKLGERFDDAMRVEFPVPVPESQRDPKLIGAHNRASIAVEISATINAQPWSSTMWVPFSQYLDASGQNSRRVVLPDARVVRVAFGRERHEFWPPMAIRLADFEMIPYDHAPTLPRDFRSELIVMRRWETRHEDLRRTTSLNEPLLERTPFQPREGVLGVVNAIGWAFSKVAPTQYKFSQTGWDQDGWMQSVSATQAGQLKRPFARYTILGVGNNPGIYIVAAGAVMMSIGIPWAFYIKPWIMRLRKRKIQAQLAAGTYPHTGRDAQRVTRTADDGLRSATASDSNADVSAAGTQP